MVTGFESGHKHPNSPGKSPSKSNASAASSTSRAKTKSKSISKALGIGKSRRKQLKEKNEAELREQLLKQIKSEHSKSKSQKRQKGLESLVPSDKKQQLKGFEPKEPGSPTKHRKNYCSSHEKHRVPLKKSANSKWSNNQQSARKDQMTVSRSGSKEIGRAHV